MKVAGAATQSLTLLRMPEPSAKELSRQYDKILTYKAEVQRRLIVEDRRLDVLAKVLGYSIFPFHEILIRAMNDTPGPWRLYLAPRGSGKSTIITIIDSVMQPLLNPNVRMLIASRVKDQAKDILTEIQGCFENERFLELFGNLKGEKWGTGEATVKTRTKKWKEPTWLAAGADGPVTSKHFDIAKVDDLVDEKNSRTEGERDRIRTFFYKTLVPTFIPKREDGTPCQVDVTGTRYNPEDLYGHMIEVDPAFQGNICEIPALVNAKTGEPDPINGESIVPEIIPEKNLHDMRVSMGSANFDSQYQQSTDRMKGDIFQNDEFRHYSEDPFKIVEKYELKVWAACDLAIGEKEQDDEYADVVIGVDDRHGPESPEVYFLEIFHKRISYEAQIKRAKYIFARWDPIRFGIESNAFQKTRLGSVYRELGETIGDRCVPIFTDTDKVTRAWKLQARYEAGRIWHREKVHEDLEDQLVKFPKKKLKDLVDAAGFAVTLGCVMRARRKRKRRVGLFGGSKSLTRRTHRSPITLGEIS